MVISADIFAVLLRYFYWSSIGNLIIINQNYIPEISWLMFGFSSDQERNVLFLCFWKRYLMASHKLVKKP